jgi:GntR family transcriptional regulator/MocR family aminotransferase
VYRQLREYILGGALGPGARLPSARTLAADLAVSRNTVEAAFEQLAAEGFIRRRTGSGTYVSPMLAEAAPFARGVRSRGPSAVIPAAATVAPRLSARGRLIAELGMTEIEADGHLGPCATDVELFPLRTWNRLLARRSRQAGTAALLPSESAGVPELRAAIAQYLRLARGVRCEDEQVVVFNGTQQSIDLAARLLLDPGGIAAMENPGYPSARAAFRAAGARVHGAEVDDEGIVLQDLPAARLLYVTPSHQYPLGITMSLSRRLAAVRWATLTGGWIIEDDYDSEFRYEGRPLAALQGLDTAGRTLYAGTFNKVLFPGLRLAYLVVPAQLVDAFAAGRRLLDGFTPRLIQLTLADFITEGHFSTHLRAARQHYAARRDILLEAMAAAWGEGVPRGPADTGLHLVVHLPPGTDDQRIARSAPAGAMGVAPLSHYYDGRTRRAGLLLSYGAAHPTAIRHTVRALAPLVGRTKGATQD